ncbi:MAG: extracellular solute-binding protein [Chloroflexales bacterium]
MKRPLTVIFSLLIATLTLVAGCGQAPQATQPTLQLPSSTQPPSTNRPSPPPSDPATTSNVLQQALAGNYKGKTVTVGGEWMESDYMKSLQGFESLTGIDIQYASINDEFAPSFLSMVDAGKGPDVVEFTGVNSIQYWAEQGKLVDISTFVDRDTLRAAYDQDLLDWATVDGPLGSVMAGVWAMAFISGVVWYPKAAFDKAGYQVPATWTELLALSDQIVKDGGTPWCIENGGDGVEGLSAVHWISDIMLRTTSPAEYDTWVKGDLKFDSPQVKHAVQLMSDVWFKPGYSSIKRQDINTTYWWQVMPRMVDNPPKCWLFKAPSYVTGYDGQSVYTAFTSKEFGTDYAFFLLPPIDQVYGTPVVLYGHIHGMFHDRPEVRALIEYLMTGAQLEAWIKSAGRFGISLHKDAQLDWYPPARGERAFAEVLRNTSIRRFNAINWLSNTVGDQFLMSINAYVNGDIDLDMALKQIDAAASPPSPTTSRNGAARRSPGPMVTISRLLEQPSGPLVRRKVTTLRPALRLS